MSSPSTATVGGKKHWLLVIEDSTDYVWNYFLKEKSELKNVVVCLIKNLKMKYDIQVWYLLCDNSKENVDFERTYKQEGMGM